MSKLESQQEKFDREELAKAVQQIDEAEAQNKKKDKPSGIWGAERVKSMKIQERIVARATKMQEGVSSSLVRTRKLCEKGLEQENDEDLIEAVTGVKPTEGVKVIEKLAEWIEIDRLEQKKKEELEQHVVNMKTGVSNWLLSSGEVMRRIVQDTSPDKEKNRKYWLVRLLVGVEYANEVKLRLERE